LHDQRAGNEELTLMANNPQQDNQPNTDPKRAQPMPDQGGDPHRMGREDEKVEKDDGQEEDMPRQ
jgi:hypothetical protein